MPKNISQLLKKHINMNNPNHSNPSKKRTFTEYDNGVSQTQRQSQENQNQHKQGSKLRMSHQLIFSKLMNKNMPQNKNLESICSQTSRCPRLQCQISKSLFSQTQCANTSQIISGDAYNTTTDAQSSLNSSTFSIRQSLDEDNDSEDEISQKQSTILSQLEDDQSQNEINYFQDSTSVLFIPFEKTQQQIKEQKRKQEQLTKLYTPLNYYQIFPWYTDEVKQVEDTLIRFHQQIRAFYKYIRPSEVEHNLRLEIFSHIKQVIRGLYPQAQVHPFGSFATKLYLPDGDIDIVALIQADTSNENRTQQFYYEIYNEFKKHHRSKYCYIEYLSKAKIPLVKMYDRNTGFSIDISLNQRSGLQQIQQVQKIKKSYPQFKYLIFIMKVFLKIRKLGQTYSGGVGSFLLVCMIYHFLREFHKRTPIKEKPFYSLGDYVLSFFSFYFMNVDLYRQTINIRTGLITSRKRKPYSISVLSPLDDRDIGKKAYRMLQILNVMKNRYQLIRQKSFEQGESILKQLINPSMTQFEYFELKQKFACLIPAQEQIEYEDLPFKQILEQKQIKDYDTRRNYYRVRRVGARKDSDLNNGTDSFSY